MENSSEGLIFFVAHRGGKDDKHRVSKRANLRRPAKQENRDGKLRVERKGSIFTLSACQNGFSEFELIDQLEVASADVQKLRFAADHGNSDALVDLLIVDASVQAGEGAFALLTPPGLVGVGSPGTRYWFWIFLGTIPILGGVIIALRVWLAKRSRETA